MSKKRLLSCVLSLLVATVLLLDGCRQSDAQKNEETPTDSNSSESSGEQTVTGDIALLLDGVCLYESVVYSADGGETEAEAAQSVYSCMRELAKSIKLRTLGEYDGSRKEIVVTLSSEYPETARLQAGLKYNDYIISQEGNKLVVTAHSGEGLEAVVKKLVRMVVAASNVSKKNVYIDGVTYEAKYKLSSFTVAGNDIKDYVIIYPKVASDTDLNYLPAALAWQSMIGNACGYLLPVADDSAEAGAKEILIGDTNREALGKTGLMSYSVGVSGERLVVSSGGVYSAEKSSEQFKREFVDKGGELALDTSLSLSYTLLDEPELPRAEGTDLRIMSSNVLCELPGYVGGSKELPVDPRLEIFIGNLYAYRPDIVTGCEVSERWVELLRAYLGEGYRVILDKRDDGKQSYSLIIYNENALELTDSGVQPYTESDNVKCRNMAWGIFKSRSTEKELAVIATHWNQIDQPTATQGDELNAKIAELSANGTRPVLSGGDFNVYAESRPDIYNNFIDGGVVNNCKAIAENLRNDIGTVSNGVGSAASKNSKTIDYIFATKDVRCLMFMTVITNCTVDMSDHHAILADVKF